MERPKAQRLSLSPRQYLSAVAQIVLHSQGRIELTPLEVEECMDVLFELVETGNDLRQKHDAEVRVRHGLPPTST